MESDKLEDIVDVGIEIPKDDMFEAREALDSKVKSLIRHETELKRAVDEISEIHDFVTKFKKEPSQFFKYTSDKEYVILGTVVIAMMAIFWIPDPGNVVMAIVTGLFGLATGRAMSDRNKD